MNNFSVENLSKIVQTGDAEGLVGGGEASVLREMQKNGMQSPGSNAGSSTGAFIDALKGAVEQTNVAQVQADTAVRELVAGRNKNIHETMLTVEKADASLKLMMQVRNKILDAYREIMRMQV